MKPILILPPSARDEVEKGGGGGPRPPHTPGRQVQARRLDRAFASLADYFHNVQLQTTAAGYEPEKTLVLQAAGGVQNVARVLRQLGLLYISDVETEELEPDEYFWLEEKGARQEKPITSYLYLTMTNARGLQTLITEWNRYKRNEPHEPRDGKAPLRHLFDQLYDIRFWSTEDRLRDTGLLEDWKARVAQGSEALPVEIELWHVPQAAQRGDREHTVRSLVQDIGGQVRSRCVIPEIGYHALLANIPPSSVAQLLQRNDTGIGLLKADAVSFFRPLGQCLPPDDAFSRPAEAELSAADAVDTPSSMLEPPVVALFDGLPLENHAWLRGSLRIDDPDNYSSAYQPHYQTHGTAMASLIVHGDKNKENPPLASTVYVRPVLQPETVHWDGRHHERVPENTLPVDLVHRAVRRLFEGENGEAPVAPTVRIINLSLGDASRLYDDRIVSPWAKLLDWLSTKYNVLFVVSAGNHANDITLMGVDNKTFATMTAGEKQKALFTALHADMPNRRLYSPAEAVNAITAGGLHEDDYDGPVLPNLIDMVNSAELPSPINPISWGQQRSTKPEILMPAGKVLYHHRPYVDEDDVVLQVKTSTAHPPGQKVAAPTVQAGSINGYAYTCGTSNAAALATRQLALLRETLLDIRGSEFGNQLTPAHEVVMLKALLVHGAEVTRTHQGLKSLVSAQLKRHFKALAARFVGYGPVNTVRIRGCTDNQATLIQSGLITTRHDQVFELPLPACLNAKPFNRRLVVTIAWLSPVNANSHNSYRDVRLKYEPVMKADTAKNPLRLDNRSYDDKMPKKGTAIHEVLTGDRASPYVEGGTLKIRVRCMAGPTSEADAIPFGIVATLDSTEKGLPIYEEVKSAVEAKLRARVAQRA